jgi:hypothetical protein
MVVDMQQAFGDGFSGRDNGAARQVSSKSFPAKDQS